MLQNLEDGREARDSRLCGYSCDDQLMVLKASSGTLALVVGSKATEKTRNALTIE